MDPKQPQQPTDEGHQPSRAEGRLRVPLENPSLLELQLTGESTIQEGSSGYPTLPRSGYLPEQFLPDQRVERADNVDLPGVVVKSEEVNAAEAMLTLSQTPVVDPKGLVASVDANQPAHRSPAASLEGDKSLPSQPLQTVSQDVPHVSAAELAQPGPSTSGYRSPVPQQDTPVDSKPEENPLEGPSHGPRLDERSRIRTEKPNVLNVGNLEELISHFNASNINQCCKRCPRCNMRPSTYERLPFWCKVNWELEVNGLKIPQIDYGQPVFLLNTNKADRYFGKSEKTTGKSFFDSGTRTSFGEA